MTNGRHVTVGHPQRPALLGNTQTGHREHQKKVKVLLYLPGKPDSLVYEIHTGKEGSKTERRDCVKTSLEGVKGEEGVYCKMKTIKKKKMTFF